MAGIEYYIIDLESTGLLLGFHEVIEISVIRCSDRMQISRQIKCENPNNASFDALKITGKTIQDLKYGVSKKQAVQDINKFFSDDNLTPSHRCIIGHNIITFDKKFLHRLWEDCNSYFPAHLFLDTLQIMRKLRKDLGLKKAKIDLQSSCTMMGITKTSQFHSAKGDSRNNYLLWQKLQEQQEIDMLEFIKTYPHAQQQNLLNEDTEETDA